MRVACVMMQRNEINALEPWLRYHSYLFGIENLYVIDHGSDHHSVMSILDKYEKKGLHIFRLSKRADYRLKGEFVSQILMAAAASQAYDILFPLDCDEFLAIRRENGQYSCDRKTIFEYLGTLLGRKVVYEVKENLVNILELPGKFHALPYQKVFFLGDYCGVVDHGSHQDVSGQQKIIEETRLIYIHFHLKKYERQVAASLEKLRPYVDVDDRAELEVFRGPGWHLVSHILGGEKAYLDTMYMMRIGSGAVEVEGLLSLFQKLGIKPLFTEI